MKKRLIIFDCFGVIFDEIAPPFFKRHFEEEKARELKDKYFVPADRGEISREELFEKMSRELNIEKAQILREWEELTRLREYMVPVIERLSETADTALLSNAPLGFVEDLFEKHDLVRLFDKLFVSSSYKMAKPEPEFYRLCVDSFGKEYDEIFMIDDNIKNLEPLDSLGIKGILFTDAEDMLEQLRD